MDTVGERLKWIRDVLGVPARQLSEYAGRSQAWVGQVIRGDLTGERIPAQCLKGIAERTGVPYAWLAYGEGKPYAGSPDYDSVAYPSLADVIAMVRSRRDLDDETRAMVVDRLTAYGSGGDKGHRYYLDRAKDLILGAQELDATISASRKHDPNASKRRSNG